MVSPRIVDSFGPECYARGLSPLKRNAEVKSAVFGFDTEYTQDGELVCYQLAFMGKGALFTDKLTLSGLVDACRSLCGAEVDLSRIHLVSFFSVAELQHLPVYRRARRVRYYGGSVDVEFEECAGSRITVFDLARFFPRESLRDVARRFGLRKLSVKGINRVCRSSLRSKKFRLYAIQDATVVESIFRQLQKASLVDLLRHSTPAMSATASLRRNWVRAELVPPSPAIRRAALLALHGGRAEAYIRGAVSFAREYDIKSSYPSSCISFKALPTKGDWRRAARPRDSDIGYVDCSWDFRGACYPCLGQEIDGVLLFASSGRGWVTVDEFRLAESLGARLRVYRARVAREGAGRSELCDFMESALRDRAKPGAAGIVAKLAANSVIGKLGQKTRIVDWNGWLRWLRDHVSEDEFLQGVQLQSDMIRALGFDGGWSFGSCYAPEWASLILGRARARISTLADKCNALYVHTDSVWTVGKLNDQDVTLKAEGSAVIARGKVGMIGDRIAHHGVRDSGIARRALQLIGNKCEPPAKYSFERPVRFREWSRIGGRLGRWIHGVKRLGFDWDEKRRLLADGTTVPWASPLEFLEARKIARARRRAEHDQEIHS